MKTFSFSLVMGILLVSTTLFAQEPVDSQVASALDDISRYENQFAGQTSVNKSSINRTLKLLGLTRQRLDSSPNQTDPSWIAADARYNALVGQLNGMLSPTAPASATTPATPVAPAATAPAQPAAATSPSTNSAPPAPAGASQPQMISQQRVRVQKMARDIDSRLDTMNQNGVKPFQSPEYVAGYQKSLDNFKQSLTRYSEFSQDPDVITVANKINEFENMMVFGKQQAAADLAELGDVQAKLIAINQSMRQIEIPPTPEPPYQDGQIEQWIMQLAEARNTAKALYEPLPLISEKAYLPDDRLTPESGGKYDLQDVDRLSRYLMGIAETVDAEVNTFSQNLDLQVNTVKTDLDFYNGFDPADRQDQSNQFLMEGRADEVRAQLEKNYLVVSEAVNMAKLLGLDSYDSRVALLEKVKATQEKYEENHARALDLVRMPPAASDDSDLEEIAEETLANYEDVGEIERLVINADKRHLTKETSEAKFDDIDVSLSGDITLTGTETTYFYEWDEFQVATAEPVGDKYFIFYSKLKFFTSGASTTPLNRWIIASRFQGSEIPKANIDED